jgi:hypothetical protein
LLTSQLKCKLKIGVSEELILVISGSSAQSGSFFLTLSTQDLNSFNFSLISDHGSNSTEIFETLFLEVEEIFLIQEISSISHSISSVIKLSISTAFAQL